MRDYGKERGVIAWGETLAFVLAWAALGPIEMDGDHRPLAGTPTHGVPKTEGACRATTIPQKFSAESLWDSHTDIHQNFSQERQPQGHTHSGQKFSAECQPPRHTDSVKNFLNREEARSGH